jgi:hypothetical protein
MRKRTSEWKKEREREREREREQEGVIGLTDSAPYKNKTASFHAKEKNLGHRRGAFDRVSWAQ